ncbi:MAG: hypothetical protein Q8N08_05470, partial [Methanobacteriaceae archaeon]|nr:hypothetical protein [Methanobacteriaceae archaeon]
RMSTFIVGNPLSEEEGYSTGGRGTTPLISCVDNEYFRKVSGANIRINLLAVRDYGALSWPDIAEFRISDTYLGRLGLQRTYTYP